MKNWNELTVLVFIMVVVTLIQGCAGAVVAGAAGGASAVYDRRTMGTIIEDESIEWKAQSNLLKNKEVSKHAHISVTSYNNVVLLSGQAESATLRKQVVELVRTIEKVRRVHNEIAIAKPVPLKIRSQDAWITAKVKGELAKKKGINPLHVKVITENGVVYLMGIVTRAEAKIAAQNSSTVKGVKRIVKLFEYLD